MTHHDLFASIISASKDSGLCNVQTVLDEIGKFPLGILLKDTWAILGDLFTGVATSVVVFLELGLQIWHEKRKRPNFTVEYKHGTYSDNSHLQDHDPDFSSPQLNHDQNNVNELWIRVFIKNGSYITADGVDLSPMNSVALDENASESRPM